jgi:hypothetical protein
MTADWRRMQCQTVTGWQPLLPAWREKCLSCDSGPDHNCNSLSLRAWQCWSVGRVKILPRALRPSSSPRTLTPEPIFILFRVSLFWSWSTEIEREGRGRETRPDNFGHCHCHGLGQSDGHHVVSRASRFAPSSMVSIFLYYIHHRVFCHIETEGITFQVNGPSRATMTHFILRLFAARASDVHPMTADWRRMQCQTVTGWQPLLPAWRETYLVTRTDHSLIATP